MECGVAEEVVDLDLLQEFCSGPASELEPELRECKEVSGVHGAEDLLEQEAVEESVGHVVVGVGVA